MRFALVSDLHLNLSAADAQELAGPIEGVRVIVVQVVLVINQPGDAALSPREDFDFGAGL